MCYTRATKADRPCSTVRLRQCSGRVIQRTSRGSERAATHATPVEQSELPTTTFESIAADFFDLAGVHYLVTVNRLSRWLHVTRAAPGSAGSGAKDLIACLRLLFADKGVPHLLSSDGGTKFTAAETRAFLDTWKVKHRLSSAHFPQSNGRAEVAVKSAKRLLQNHCTPTGRLDRRLHAGYHGPPQHARP